MTLLHIAVLAPFLFALLVPFLFKYLRKIHTGWFVMIVPLVLFIYFVSYLPTTSDGHTVMKRFEWVPSLGINFDLYVDGLSLLFALLITGIGTLVILYSIYYLAGKKERLNHFYVYILLFMGAMLGVVLSDNIIVLYVFWEVTSISSALLISYWYTKDASVYGAQKSMYVTVFGGLTMLGGFSLLYVMAETFSIREMIAGSDIIMNHELFLPAMILVLVGAFTKSAQFPFHIWLPDAMEAPTPVSAYLHSATMVKAGIYLVARMTPVFGGGAEWFWIITSFGIFTMLWGGISALRQKDLKAILAFSTISQLGMIMSLLGAGSAAFYYMDGDNALYTTAILAAVFHLINHATFKGSLFMVAGIIDHETGTRDIRKLGGLMTIMPISATLSVIGLAAMAGLPPFNGFLSKELFFTGIMNVVQYDMWNGDTIGFILPVIAWIASIFTFTYSAIIFFRTFRGKFKPDMLPVKKVHEAPIGMLISPIILVLAVLVISIFPNMLAYTVIEPAMMSILPGILSEGSSFYVDIYHWHGINLELTMTIGVVIIGTILYMTMDKWSKLGIYQKEQDIITTVYDYGYDALIKGSQLITRAQMTGMLRDYLVYMLIFIVGLMTYTMFRFEGFHFSMENASDIDLFMYVILATLSVTIILLPKVNNRMTAIILAGFVGFLVAFIFTVFRAPDLALTQLMVETVSVILFMAVFYHLPNLTKDNIAPLTKSINIVVAGMSGLMVTFVSISAFTYGQMTPFEAISQYFIENSKSLGGGYNMVNVILVDFRGLDTMLELLVLGIAALGVISLIKLRVGESDDV
ncbi:Na+/H+ antiporter subunit A [Lacicoccus qingdaonensis]|uniref:Multisubunit sodium/proton antiporter, MrpA subunit n=1 Tax=Lacicoccus qingdaonensis TaxID=576118 RepID=A0A1G9IGG1_9BACL|nr:Na+/H+ antiporter subunit A [Salinicoccus qingdaonensis]SDL24156.1 multisubunit sodium/proton antiporter, MrpA subunit [Salinicoccus qingdaonensis]